MYHFVKILLWSLIFLKQESATGIEITKFAYPQDLSEHCRRRVMPSVFLGRHAVDAYAKVLHFQKIDLPYSCFISVRTETGSSIILVLQLITETSHLKPCQESSNQMLVYEMGETFGGYWGPMPEAYMRSRPDNEELYTLKTTTDVTYSINITAPETTVVKEETTTPQPSVSNASNITEQQELIELNIPLVNVSAILQPGAYQPEKIFNIDENFEFLYDVMPRENFSYQTSILPLAQISLNNQKYDRQNGIRKQMARYQFDYDLAFTPDIRLTYPRVTLKRILYPKYTYANRLGKLFKEKHSLLATHKKKSHIKSYVFMSGCMKPLQILKGNLHPYLEGQHLVLSPNCEICSRIHQSKVISILTPPLQRLTTTDKIKYKFTTRITDNGENTPIEVKSIDGFMREFIKNINYTKPSANEKNQINMTKLLAELSNTRIEYNASAYPKFKNSNLHQNYLNILLKPTASENNNSFIEYSLPFTKQTSVTTISKITSTEQMTKTTKINYDVLNNTQISVSQPTVLQRINKSDTTEIIYDNHNIITEKPDFLKTNVNKGKYIINLATPSKVSLTSESGSLVDRESWENVVQVAPVIAGLLNQSIQDTYASLSKRSYLNSTERVRKKRHLHAIAIDNAKPQTMTTKETDPTTPSTTFHVWDLQDFFRLVELRDDELHERVALKYLRQYMGPSVFNICESNEPKERRVALINSSRIVIALYNFTIEKLTVIMTPGRTLLEGEFRCSMSNLECQVAGSRVCIDAMSACDGVPNCGAYDIFDEDRLMCGAAVGLQHNVWLAAVTFLAVMLTVLYTVHYWLNRCVPKVSEAFFIYSDGDENTLYLDPIMRSPNDVSDRTYGNIIDDEILYTNKKNTLIKTLTCCNWLAKLCNKLRKNKIKEDINNIHQLQPVKRMYSFTQTEIRKIVTKDFSDVCVQTGESLEMSDLRLQSLDNTDLLTKKLTDSRKQFTVFPHSMGKWDNTSIDSEDRSYELSLIKLFKDTKELNSSESKEAVLSLTLDSISDHKLRGSEEKEIQSQLYDRNQKQSAVATTSPVHSITTVSEIHADVTMQTQPKRLRFIEEPVAIATINEESFEKDQHVVDIGFRQTNQRSRSNREDDEQMPSTSRDFKRFFSGGKLKGKKSKYKKSQMPLR